MTTDNLPLPEWPEGYEHTNTTLFFPGGESKTGRCAITLKSSAFALICAGLWRQDELNHIGNHPEGPEYRDYQISVDCRRNSLSWLNEARRRVERERGHNS